MSPSYQPPGITIDQQLDACGLQCPMPLLKAKLALNNLAAGQVLEVLATDAGSYRDFHAWVGQSAHELLLAEASNPQQAFFRYWIRKGA